MIYSSFQPIPAATTSSGATNSLIDDHVNKLREQAQQRPQEQRQPRRKTDITLPDPSDQFRFYSQEDKDKLGVKNGRIGSELNKINADIYHFIKGELIAGHLVCRNTVAAYVAKSDKLSFSDEWFASFCELYNLVMVFIPLFFPFFYLLDIYFDFIPSRLHALHM